MYQKIHVLLLFSLCIFYYSTPLVRINALMHKKSCEGGKKVYYNFNYQNTTTSLAFSGIILLALIKLFALRLWKSGVSNLITGTRSNQRGLREATEKKRKMVSSGAHILFQGTAVLRLQRLSPFLLTMLYSIFYWKKMFKFILVLAFLVQAYIFLVEPIQIFVRVSNTFYCASK